jgi:DNA-directed RNA polymerase specialized sigma24 family protein
MITAEAQSALLVLYKRANASSDIYWLERIDRALDECVNNAGRNTAPAYQVRSSLANAKKAMDKRRDIAAVVPIEDGREAETVGVRGGDLYAAVDALLWLEATNGLSDRERELLLGLTAGEDAESLSRRVNVPVQRMRERISRARQAAGAAWNHDQIN